MAHGRINVRFFGAHIRRVQGHACAHGTSSIDVRRAADIRINRRTRCVHVKLALTYGSEEEDGSEHADHEYPLCHLKGRVCIVRS